MMEAHVQQITMMVYPQAKRAEPWTLEAHVYGEWAVHEPHPEEGGQIGDYPWQISHVPTGSIAFVANQKEVAIEAVQRLLALEKPHVEVAHNGNCYEFIQPLSLEWMEAAALALMGLEIFGVSGSSLLSPKKMLLRVRLEQLKRNKKNA